MEEICSIIGADSLHYLRTERLPQLVDGRVHLCEGCFTGVYPMKTPEINIHDALE